MLIHQGRWVNVDITLMSEPVLSAQVSQGTELPPWRLAPPPVSSDRRDMAFSQIPSPSPKSPQDVLEYGPLICCALCGLHMQISYYKVGLGNPMEVAPDISYILRAPSCLRAVCLFQVCLR